MKSYNIEEFQNLNDFRAKIRKYGARKFRLSWVHLDNKDTIIVFIQSQTLANDYEQKGLTVRGLLSPTPGYQETRYIYKNEFGYYLYTQNNHSSICVDFKF